MNLTALPCHSTCSKAAVETPPSTSDRSVEGQDPSHTGTHFGIVKFKLETGIKVVDVPRRRMQSLTGA
jgi:hypothetical protein